jgi:CspA family cold shock protein
MRTPAPPGRARAEGEEMSEFDPTPELQDDTPIDNVRLSTRIRNALNYAGLKTVGEVRETSDGYHFELSGYWARVRRSSSRKAGAEGEGEIAMATGTLKMWNADRGFGFIKDDSGGPDMFLHISALQSAGVDPDNLMKGDRLIFDVASRRDGRTQASNVRRSG